MNHVDVFTGIAGFALAAREVWGDDYKNICFCDNNKFCQEIIKKNFGERSLIYEDIREVTRERIIADTGIQEQRRIPGIKRKENTAIRKSCVDILTGGFPCQPFSCAGKRGGTEDNRYLWPEMHRVIKDTKPRWIIAENVRGILTIEKGLVFEQVCLDLEREGYAIQPFIIPACAINAPHRRDRVWIVANCKHERRILWSSQGNQDKEGVLSNKQARGKTRCPITRHNGNDPDTKSERLQRWGQLSQSSGKISFTKKSWEQNWLEVATEFCGVDDGLPVELDGFKLTKAGHRIERLKALGNAIVPQVAMEIMKAIKKIDYEANK